MVCAHVEMATLDLTVVLVNLDITDQLMELVKVSMLKASIEKC